MGEKNAPFRTLSLKGAKDILAYTELHIHARYSDMEKLASTYTLSRRLRDMLKYGLLEHHFCKGDSREEWYEITDKGRKILSVLNTLEELLSDEKR